jgi:uncharacterized protein YkwD
MRRALLLLPLTVLVLAGCAAPPGSTTPTSAPSPTTVPTPTTAPATSATPAWVEEMLARINAERAAVGAAPVQLCANLMEAAQAHSQDQAARSVMSHTGSDGSTMVQRAERAGYVRWTALAENVAAGYTSVTSVMSGWMGSTGHRTNLLSTSYQHVGLGRAASGSGALYWTQDFGRSGSC